MIDHKYFFNSLVIVEVLKMQAGNFPVGKKLKLNQSQMGDCWTFSNQTIYAEKFPTLTQN